MAKTPFPSSLWPIEVLLGTLSDTARNSARRRMAPARTVGATIRPGRDTPLWNQLIADVRPLLRKRGEKAQLARLLGLQRQAVNEYFVSGRRMPDAERTLLLLEWLRLRQTGKKPAW
jgi:hypothetical protein